MFVVLFCLIAMMFALVDLRSLVSVLRRDPRRAAGPRAPSRPSASASH